MNSTQPQNLFSSTAQNLLPAYFALVMATGIISIAAHLLHLSLIAEILLGINLIAYVALWVLMLTRIIWHFPFIRQDMANHARGPGFFTLVAGTCVLGSQLETLLGAHIAATVLWFLGIGLWMIVMYAFFTSVTVQENKPSLESGINGAWLIASVATQSVSILGTLLAPQFSTNREIILFFSLTMYLLGCMLYLSIITLIFYRFTFLKLTAADLSAPYWINMGAVAITTLAGATLILNAPLWNFLEELLPFLKGFTLFFWTAGTWWIPFLGILGIWRHIYKRYPLSYDPQYWGMVFPLGMYTTCTLQLSKAIDLSFLMQIPTYFIYIALFAWTLTFIGLLRNLSRSIASAKTHKVQK